jgi:hypothetical protein
MERHRSSQAEKGENVLAFRPVRSGNLRRYSGIAPVNEERGLLVREDRLGTWSKGAWVLLAWLLAMSRLLPAARHHDVFDNETSLAFVVAVLMPVLYWRSFVSALRETAVALRKTKAARRAKRQRSRAQPPTRPRSYRSFH